MSAEAASLESGVTSTVESSHPRFEPVRDLPAALVVFLVALPLCLGIALATGAPLLSGVISGIVGGLAVGFLSGAELSVAGPSAAAIGVMVLGIQQLGGFNGLLAAIMVAGVVQLIAGFLKAGVIADFFPVAVIRGMLAAVGLILVLKQIPHFFGWDSDFEGDDAFLQNDGRTTLSELFDIFDHVTWGATVIAVIALVMLLIFELPAMKRQRWTQLIPGSLFAVIVAGVLANVLPKSFPQLALDEAHFVTLPTFRSVSDLMGQIPRPDFSALGKIELYGIALSLMVISSLEALLSIDAADKLDPYKRTTPANRELKAQGLGNMLSGFLGGLPVTAVIIRSTVNVSAGARTKLATVGHGTLLLIATLIGSTFLNHIPLSALAALLILSGYKLARPSIIKDMYRRGTDQFVPFIVTIGAILFTDLIKGVACGILVGIAFIIRANFKRAISVTADGNQFLISMNGSVTFMNKSVLKRAIDQLPKGSYVLIDGTRADFIDKDIVEVLRDFVDSSARRRIEVELKRSPVAASPLFKTEASTQDYKAGAAEAFAGVNS